MRVRRAARAIEDAHEDREQVFRPCTFAEANSPVPEGWQAGRCPEAEHLREEAPLSCFLQPKPERPCAAMLGEPHSRGLSPLRSSAAAASAGQAVWTTG